MPYNLRPERKLKRPRRFLSVSPDELDPPPNSSASTVQDKFVPQQVPGLPANQAPQHLLSTPLQYLQTPQRLGHLDFPPFPEEALNTPCTQSTRGMPTTKNSRKTSRRQQPLDEGEGIYREVSKSARRTRSPAVGRAASIPPSSIYPSTKPSAFPSLSTDERPDEPSSAYNGQPGVRNLMEAREKSDRKKISAIILSVDNMYANKRFPDSVREQERKWYRQLTARLRMNKGARQIAFASLYPSIRQTIIDQVRDDFREGSYYDPYHPVICILRLPKSELDAILVKNTEFYDPERDIPTWLLDRKEAHPDAIVDPDEPPRGELVRAIEFLKQEHLPGSLLGEWQYPLPSVEDFLSFERPQAAKSQSYAHENGDISDSEIHPEALTQYGSNVASKSGHFESVLESQGRKKQISRKKERQTRHLCGDQDHGATDYNETGGQKRPALRAQTKRQTDEVKDLIRQTNRELADLDKNAQSSENAAAERAACALINSRQWGPRSEMRITTVDELEAINRNHPGIKPNANLIGQIRGNVGYSYQHAAPCGDRSLNTPKAYRLSKYDPIEMTSSAAEYAQMSTINSLAAHEQIAPQSILWNSSTLRVPTQTPNHDPSEDEEHQNTSSGYQLDEEDSNLYVFQMPGPPEPPTDSDNGPTLEEAKSQQHCDSGIPTPQSPE